MKNTIKNIINYKNQIYLGTVLLEKNRWVKGIRQPTLAVSDWTQQIADAGFDGLELWQNHALLTTSDERNKLKNSEVPVQIFNSYARCETEDEKERIDSVEMSNFFDATGMKYNFGKVAERHSEYTKNVQLWRELLPSQYRFLCECHGGSTMENPQQAAETLNQLNGTGYEVIIHGIGGDDEKIKNLFAIQKERITHIHADLSSDGLIDEAKLQNRIDLLHDLGFNGSYTIEFTEGVKSENQRVEILFANAARDLKLLRKCLSR